MMLMTLCLKKTGVIVERLVKIIVERKKSECTIFKRVGRKILNAQVDRKNKASKYLESNSITETKERRMSQDGSRGLKDI